MIMYFAPMDYLQVDIKHRLYQLISWSGNKYL